jgi:CheY-like chemotaxis protein
MNQPRIVIVEDERIIAEDLKRSLEMRGYRIAAIVSSGEMALEKVSEHQPDAVFMDIALSGEMDGIEAAERIQELFGIPIVYLTAYMDEERLTRAQRTGPRFSCIKPFDEGELASTMDKVLKGR